ncbi:MAG: HDOD domain-containing protein [Treponema sp.]|nr:HDOD domain-containing protein [Treponema sp.]MCL2237188.1 HDOD domain-containing protein [Treponema sp.]
MSLSEKINNYILDIPSLPVSVGKALQVCNSPNVNPSDLNHVISLDPVLTGKLLKLINSAYYGLGTHVTSLIKAITMLGLNTVKNLVLSTAVLSNLPGNKGTEGLNMEGFWHHCLCVGVMTKLLASKNGIEDKYLEEYFAAGLLHDIGKIPLNAVLASDYMQMITVADREHKPLYAVENEIAGINHCAAGEMIANLWKLDSSITDVITNHHNIGEYSGENKRLLCFTAIADYFSLVYEIGFAGNRKPVKPEAGIWEEIGLNDDAYLDLMPNLYHEMENAKVFLQT